MMMTIDWCSFFAALAWLLMLSYYVVKLIWIGGHDVNEKPLLCQFCGSDAIPTPIKVWICKKCEAQFGSYYPRCICGGELQKEVIDRWQCPDCGSEFRRGDPQWMIDKRIDAEERARLLALKRYGRSRTGRSRKRRHEKGPWPLSNYQ